MSLRSTRVAVLTIMVVCAVAMPAAGASGTTTYVCGRGLENPACEVQPAHLEFSDNHDLIASGLEWAQWGEASATAHGGIQVNWTGTPSADQGTVTVSDLRPCHGGLAYRKGVITWPGESVEVTFDCRTLPAKSRYVDFHSPSGKLGCGMYWDSKDGSSARCDVQGADYTTPLTVDCVNLDQGDSLVLGEKVASTCHGDTVLRAGAVLPYGHSRRVGDIRCTMARTGVTCRNVVTGHGFRMSRGSYRTW